MIVKKAYNMAQMMNVPMLGLVENYSYFTCPGCNERYSVFGESHIDEIAEQMDLPVLAKLPLNPEFAKAADNGKIEDIEKLDFDIIKDALQKI